jgi:hypothetical protein
MNGQNTTDLEARQRATGDYYENDGHIKYKKQLQHNKIRNRKRGE